jgi:hypothetical protein
MQACKLIGNKEKQFPEYAIRMSLKIYHGVCPTTSIISNYVSFSSFLGRNPAVSSTVFEN